MFLRVFPELLGYKGFKLLYGRVIVYVYFLERFDYAVNLIKVFDR